MIIKPTRSALILAASMGYQKALEEEQGKLLVASIATAWPELVTKTCSAQKRTWAAKGKRYCEQFGMIIVMSDVRQQENLFVDLTGLGFKCRLVTT